MKSYILLLILFLISGVLGYWYHITRMDVVGAGCAISLLIAISSTVFLLILDSCQQRK